MEPNHNYPNPNGVNIKWVYQMSWYESKRHSISHTDMYYAKPEHTHWVRDGCDACGACCIETDPWKINYISVDISTKEGKNRYEAARHNSEITETKKDKEKEEEEKAWTEGQLAKLAKEDEFSELGIFLAHGPRCRPGLWYFYDDMLKILKKDIGEGKVEIIDPETGEPFESGTLVSYNNDYQEAYESQLFKYYIDKKLIMSHHFLDGFGNKFTMGGVAMWKFV
mgnify:CR=1 FL=1|tara:strand:+ start:176 stop:847 length:672 start_codon:yes stop_codon:yes gene_type:complete